MRLAVPLLLARWWWRGGVEPGYRLAMAERLGYYAAGARQAAPAPVWLHAVSLGETLAAAPLVEQLRARQPGLRLLITHTTATGREAGTRLLRDGDAQCWLPLDTPGACQRFFAHWQPQLGVLMETEVWPTLLHAAEHAKVPVWLANARLSERSLRKGQRLGLLMQGAGARLRGVLAQTQDDADRLRRFGAADVQVCGNLKFDSTPEPSLLARGRSWRPAGRQVLLLAVSREGEEALLIKAWQASQAWQGPKPVLLVVPRHPQRFDEVELLLRQAGLHVARRSQWGEGAAALDADAWLGDSMGEMPAYYAAADLAMLGGSFAPLGGQNLIQAAACGCPLLLGPSTFNFAEAASGALAAGAASAVPDMPTALAQAQALFKDASTLQRMAQSGLQFAAAHQGAAQRMAAALLDGKGGALRN